MRQRRLNGVCAVLCALAGLCTGTGCSTILKQGFYEARGAQGQVLPMQDLSFADQNSFGEVRFAPATTTASDRIISRELLSAYDRLAPRAVEDVQAAYETDGPPLTVECELIYFQNKGMLSPALLLARVRFLSGERLVQDSLVKVESQAFRAGDEESLARATLDAIVAHCKELFKERSAEDRKRRQQELRERRGG